MSKVQVYCIHAFTKTIEDITKKIMIKATFRGTGQLNGPVPIHKIVEVDNQTAKNLGGSKKNEVKLAILATQYPGVKINPKDITVNIQRIDKKEDHDDFGKFAKKNKPKSFSFGNVLLWIVFLPFKLSWWILKSMLMGKDHINGKWHI